MPLSMNSSSGHMVASTIGFLFQQMFQHAAATGQCEYEHVICHGCREPSPEWDLLMEPTTMELIGPDSTYQDIDKLYWDVYQLHWLPMWGRCEEESNRGADLEGNFRFDNGIPRAEVASCAPRERTGMVASWYPPVWSSYGFHHHKLPNLWGDDGFCPRCPSMGPGSRGNPGRMFGEDESFYQPLTVHQMPVHLQPMMLSQPQEVLIPRMAGRKSPGGSMLWGDWGWTMKDLKCPWHWSPSPATPGWEGTLPGRCWGGRWSTTPTDITITHTTVTAWRSRALPVHLRVDGVACQV